MSSFGEAPGLNQQQVEIAIVVGIEKRAVDRRVAVAGGAGFLGDVLPNAFGRLP